MPFAHVHGSPSRVMVADSLLYVWDREGLPLYETPSPDALPLARLKFGEPVGLLRVTEHAAPDAVLYQRDLEAYVVEGYLPEWTQPARWLKVAVGAQEGYVLDTHLLPFPPPQDDPQKSFIHDDYLTSLSPVVHRVDSGGTEAFCERTRITYQNDMEYVRTDFGPCEQCGHTQYVLRIPRMSLREGVVLTLEFYRHYGLFSDESAILVKHDAEGLAIVGYGEYGHVYQMLIQTERDGLLLIEDLML